MNSSMGTFIVPHRRWEGAEEQSQVNKAAPGGTHYILNPTRNFCYQLINAYPYVGPTPGICTHAFQGRI